MVAYQCDRCKKYYNEKDPDGSPYPYIVVSLDSNGEEVLEKRLDLCLNCKETLKKWIKGKEQVQQTNE